jgi:hypothetical protein
MNGVRLGMGLEVDGNAFFSLTPHFSGVFSAVPPRAGHPTEVG